MDLDKTCSLTAKQDNLLSRLHPVQNQTWNRSAVLSSMQKSMNIHKGCFTTSLDNGYAWTYSWQLVTRYLLWLCTPYLEVLIHSLQAEHLHFLPLGESFQGKLHNKPLHGCLQGFQVGHLHQDPPRQIKERQDKTWNPQMHGLWIQASGI